MDYLLGCESFAWIPFPIFLLEQFYQKSVSHKYQ